MPRIDLKDLTPMRVVLFAAIVVGLVQPASAEQAHRAPRKSQPVPAARTAPDITAGIPPRTSPPLSSDKARDEPLKPFNLPAAPRSRMRACGQKWQQVKMLGQAGDDTWREFATKCLTESDSPETKSRP